MLKLGLPTVEGVATVGERRFLQAALWQSEQPLASLSDFVHQTALVGWLARRLLDLLS